MQHKQEQQQQLQQQQQMQHMQQQQQLRMQQQQQQASNNFEPPQQIVGMQNRLPGPTPYPPPGQMMSQAGPRPMGARMSSIPGHPAVTAGLRLNIPPQAMGSAPGTPNSALPSPALTPRSEVDEMDTGSSRGPTPGSDKMDGSVTPDMMDPNKVLKRRTSVQQQGKRRISANDGLGAKKRPRKGSRVDDGVYDNYIDTVMHQLKNLPPMSTVEPKLSHSFNACPVYGTGEVPKLMSKDIDIQKGSLEGKFGVSSLSTEGDYYSTMPFGPEPPVPYIPPVSCSQRGFYNQEFMPERRPEIPRMDGYVSPDLFYPSSPEPDAPNQKPKKKKKLFKNKPKEEEKEGEDVKKETTEVVIKQEEGTVLPESPVNLDECHSAWFDLEPDDSDDEPDKKDGPPQIISRPASPENCIVKPIPIKPKPGQTITLSDVANLDKDKSEKTSSKSGLLSLAGSLGVTPKPLKEKSEDVKQVTLTFGGSGSSKSVLKALKGLAKLLEIEAPKQWIQEDKKSSRAMYRVKREGGKDGPPLDLQSVLNRNSKVCRQCDVVIQHDMVKRKAADLPFLSKYEREECSEDILFCDENCYFQFAVKKTGGKTPEKVTNLKQLEEFQNKQKEEGIAEESPKKEEHKGPKFK